MFDKAKTKIAKKLAQALGIDLEHASMTDIVDVINENTDLNVKLIEEPASHELLESGVMQMAEVGAAAVGRGKYFRLEANPPGRPPVRGFIVVGGVVH